MKTIRTFPNLFWSLINLMILSFFGIIILVCLEWIFEIIGFFRNSGENKIGMILLLIFTSLFFSFYYLQLSNNFTFVKLNSTEIKIFQLMKFKVSTIQFKDIKGYSNSEYSYGRVPLNYKSKSIVFYFANKKPIEIVKLFNVNFENFKSDLKNFEIVYYGKEPYQTRIRKRKYKYLYLK